MKSFALQSRDFLDSPDRKRFYNEQLFTEVAPKYDRITRLLSFGRDRKWKQDMVSALPARRPQLCVDLACGTGDLTRMIHRRFPDAEVIGLDLTPAMLDRARMLTPASGISYETGDMGRLRFPDASVDLITGGYALRNAPDVNGTLTEISRVLRPGGLAAFLDFSKPSNRAGQRLVYGLLKAWGGFWGMTMHRHADVYGYIAESLARYPDRWKLRAEMKERGLMVIQSRRYFGGMLEWIIARKVC